MLIYVLIAFIIMVGISFFAIQLMNSDKKKCTYKVQATVIDIVYQSHYHDDPYTTTILGNYPRYKFTYNGKDYEVTANIAKDYSHEKVGDIVTLYINPDNPEQFHADSEKHYFFYIVLILVLVFVIFGVIMLVSSLFIK